MSNVQVLHQPDKHQFVIELEGENSVIEYKVNQNTIDFHRTYVPPSHRGKGYAQKLAKEALHFAEANSYSVVASCSFVQKYLERHKI